MSSLRTLLVQAYIQDAIAHADLTHSFQLSDFDLMNLDRLDTIAVDVLAARTGSRAAPEVKTGGTAAAPAPLSPPGAAEQWDPGAGDTTEGGVRPYVPGQD